VLGAESSVRTRRDGKELPSLREAGFADEDVPARACPRCSYPLPLSIDERPAVVVAVVGVNRVGKTHLLATSLTRAHRQRALECVGCSEFEPDENIGERFRQQYFVRLFREGKLLEKTRLEEEKVRFAPLSFNVTLEDQGSFTLILHDVAGEIFADNKKRAAWAPFLRGARGMIFVVDPRDIDSIRDRLPAVVVEADDFAYDQGTLLSACLREDGPRGGEAIPVAVVLAKADLLSQALGAEPSFLRRGNLPEERGEFAERVRATSREVADFLSTQGAHDILAPAERYRDWLRGQGGDSGKTLTFHAVSALGASPGGGDELRQKVDPINCTDPLAVVLAQVDPD
jgi:hypothetical protein